MKKLVVFAVLAAIVASCADDNPPQIEKSSELVSPRLLMDVSTESGQSPLTGILTIMPCKAGTSIYYGNYIYLLWKLHKPEADTFLRLLPS